MKSSSALPPDPHPRSQRQQHAPDANLVNIAVEVKRTVDVIMPADFHRVAIMVRRDERRRILSRSEEGRVGKECRSRWTPYHYKKKGERKTERDRPSML